MENTLKNQKQQKGKGGEMKSTIEQLIVEGQTLSEKRSWVKKGYSELMDKLNEHLKEIPTMPEDPIRYTLLEWEDREGFKHKARLVLYFSDIHGGGSVHLALDERWEDEARWYTDPLYHPDLDIMRAVGEQLGEALKYFLERIRERGIEYDPVIATLTELVAKLQ